MMDIDGQSDSQFYFQLYLKSMKKIYAFVMAAVSKPAIADEIVGNVVSYILQNHDQYRPGQDFTEWAISIAQEEILSYVEKTGGIIDESGKMSSTLKSMLFEGDSSFCCNPDGDDKAQDEDTILEDAKKIKMSKKVPR